MIAYKMQAKLKTMIYKNEQGSTLVENVISVFILTIFALIIMTTFLAGLNVYSKHFQEYARVKDIFGVIECMEDTFVTDPSGAGELEVVHPTSDGSTIQEQQGSISFVYDGETRELPGKYFYDLEGEKLGEFTVE